MIESETQFFNTLAHVELNMVRADVVQDPGDWRWSSYRAHAYGEKDAALDGHELYDALGKSDGERAAVYRAMIAGRMEQKGLGTKEVLDRGLVVGASAMLVANECQAAVHADIIPGSGSSVPV